MQKSFPEPRYILDDLDHKIIALLKKDSRITKKDLAEKLNLSRQTIIARIRNLEENKVILQYTCITNDRLLGFDVTVFILLALDRSGSIWQITADELVKRQEELDLIEIHHITGEFDVLVKMRTRNIEFLEHNLKELYDIPGIKKTNTIVCFSGIENGFPIFGEIKNLKEVKKQLRQRLEIN